MTVRSPAYGRTTIIISIDKDGIIFYKMNVYKMNAADNFSMEKIFLNCKTSKLGILKKEWDAIWSSVEMDDTKTNHLPTKPISNDLARLDDLDSLRRFLCKLDVVSVIDARKGNILDIFTGKCLFQLPSTIPRNSARS